MLNVFLFQEDENISMEELDKKLEKLQKVSLWVEILVNTGSGNGWLSDGTKPLPEPVLTSPDHDSTGSTTETFSVKKTHMKILSAKWWPLFSGLLKCWQHFFSLFEMLFWNQYWYHTVAEVKNIVLWMFNKLVLTLNLLQSCNKPLV